MRSTRRLACTLVALGVVVSAWACSSFEAAPPVEDEGGAPFADATVPDDAPAVADADAGFTCIRLAPQIDERFTEPPALEPVMEQSGKVTVANDVMVASVPNQTGARGVYARTIDIPTPRAFGHARLRFTFRDLVPPPPGFYVEAGCDIDLSDSTTTPVRRSSVRLELRPVSMRLDDAVFIGSAASDSGAGPPIVNFGPTPTDYPILIDVVRNDASLTSTASVDGGEPFTKETPLLGGIDRIGIHCGINSTSVSGASVTRYEVKLDDVVIDLCAR